MNGEEFYRYKEEALRLSNTTEPTPDNPTPWMGAFQDTELRMHNEGKDTDWMDLATRSGIRQQHNISFRGGADKTRFFITLNYVNNKGTAVGNTFKRYSVRFNLDQEFTKWLSFSTSTQLGRYDRGGATASFTRAVRMNPLAEAYNEDGSIRTTAWEDSSEAFCVNPLSSLNNRRKNLNFKVMTNNSIEIKPPFLKGFSYKLNTGYTYSNTSYRQYEGLDTYYGKRYNGILETTDSHTEDWLIENIFSYIRDFGKHHIFLTALYSAESKEYESNEAQGTGFPNDVMYYYQINKASTIEGDNEYWKQNHISQMGRINYSYDSRYLLTLTARRDGYSAFGKDKKFGIFPSAAIGWNLSNERFFKESRVAEVISRLKFRLSWGENGNEAISAYSSLPNLSTFNYLDVSHSATYGFYPQRLASPDLGWETTTSTNFGFDISLWDDRVQSTFDYYWTRTKDLLLNRSIPIINGTDSLMSNIGKTKGNGFEFQIISNNITKKDFQWSTTLNLSHHHTEIVNVGLYDENGKPMDDIASGWFIGEPIDVNYSYRNIGVWQYVDKSKNISEPQDDRNPDSIPGYIKYKDMNGDGLITTEDRDIIGSREPWLNFGLMNNFSYKDFYLSIFITGQFGVTMLNNLYTTSTSTYRNNRLMVNFWTPDNPTNDYPMNSADTHVSPHGACFYEKTDYVRLADITFGYRLPEKIVKKTFLKGVEAYINVKNPYTWTNWTGMDPEFVNGESQQYANPPVRSYTFGIKVTL
jgi:TonB-linked SusC/RagA family outer membrane protein